MIKEHYVRLDEMLVYLVANLLPEGSGPYKILETIVKMKRDKNHIVFIKVIFWWEFDNQMVISYSFEDCIENFDDEELMVVSDKDPNWKHDGFNFYKGIMINPGITKIPFFKIVKVQEVFTFSEKGKSKYFRFKRK